MNLESHAVNDGVFMHTVGEVVMHRGAERNNCVCAWTLPVTRLQTELGADATHRGDGTATLIFPG